jgi:hypothetical protein
MRALQDSRFAKSYLAPILNLQQFLMKFFSAMGAGSRGAEKYFFAILRKGKARQFGLV